MFFESKKTGFKNGAGRFNFYHNRKLYDLV